MGSPFPYRESALLYCAPTLPDRRNPEATAALHEELWALITAAGGRTLALFTSWRAMQGAVEALRPSLRFTVLAQNDLPKTRLLEDFAAEESTCLFATMSFWQGVDVPGPTLSLVTIDRAPLPPARRPFARSPAGTGRASAFRLVDLPRATTLLAQGTGRLIRSSTDTGVVAVLDPRLATAGYRRTILEALPPMTLTTRHDAVARPPPAPWPGVPRDAPVVSVAQALDRLGPLLPAFLHPDEQLEERTGRELGPHGRCRPPSRPDRLGR